MVHGKKKYGLVVTVLALFVVAGATVYWLRGRGRDGKPIVCVTPAPSREVIEAINKALEQTRQERVQRPAESVTIPVHFHIITNASGSEGDVTDDAVKWQIAVLNAAFSGTAGPPHAKPADTPFRFSLGSIERIRNDDLFKMSFNELTPTPEEKQAMARNIGDKSVLNIYTAKLEGAVSGWARVPFSVTASPSPSPVTGLNGVPLDGVVLRCSTLPTVLPPPFNEGDTATHEVGHWLGLLHVFQGGCVDPGDYVGDTTFQAGNGSACYGDSCIGPSLGGSDPVENFMNTTGDPCMFKFTNGQSSRMDYYHMTFRTP